MDPRLLIHRVSRTVWTLVAAIENRRPRNPRRGRPQGASSFAAQSWGVSSVSASLEHLPMGCPDFASLFTICRTVTFVVCTQKLSEVRHNPRAASVLFRKSANSLTTFACTRFVNAFDTSEDVWYPCFSRTKLILSRSANEYPPRLFLLGGFVSFPASIALRPAYLYERKTER
jgi:hypothetical protein